MTNKPKHSQDGSVSDFTERIAASQMESTEKKFQSGFYQPSLLTLGRVKSEEWDAKIIVVRKPSIPAQRDRRSRQRGR